jgi:hypothetical protein
LAFARHQFELSQPQDDGSPLVAHLQAAWRATGKMPQMLVDAPELPEGLQSLWAAFLELHDSRGSTGWGAARITFMDMDAWQRVTGGRLAPWQIDLIRRADNIWLAEFAPKPKADK